MAIFGWNKAVRFSNVRCPCRVGFNPLTDRPQAAAPKEVFSSFPFFWISTHSERNIRFSASFSSPTRWAISGKRTRPLIVHTLDVLIQISRASTSRLWRCIKTRLVQISKSQFQLEPFSPRISIHLAATTASPVTRRERVPVALSAHFSWGRLSLNALQHTADPTLASSKHYVWQFDGENRNEKYY